MSATRIAASFRVSLNAPPPDGNVPRFPAQRGPKVDWVVETRASPGGPLKGRSGVARSGLGFSRWKRAGYRYGDGLRSISAIAKSAPNAVATD
jgi:hypothetical protein